MVSCHFFMRPLLTLKNYLRDALRFRIQSPIIGQRRRITAKMVKKSGSGRVKIGLKSPAVIIKPLRSFSSASGARTNPITKGPKGILAHSIRKPITPKISITQTSKMVLFKAKEPMTQKTMTIGRTKLLGKYINPAMYLTELVISNHINTFAKRQAAIIPQTISAFVRNRVGPG